MMTMFVQRDVQRRPGYNLDQQATQVTFEFQCCNIDVAQN